MATRETTVTRVNDNDAVEGDAVSSPLSMVRNIIYVLFAALESLLFIRFLLALFGANRTNGFADFVYSITAPFVAPFRGLFSINTEIGVGNARFEYETLIAMVVYGLVAMLIIMLLRIPDRTAPNDV